MAVAHVCKSQLLLNKWVTADFTPAVTLVLLYIASDFPEKHFIFITHEKLKSGQIVFKLGTGEKTTRREGDRWTESASISNSTFLSDKEKGNRIVNMKEHLKTQHSFLGMYQATSGCSGRNFASSQKQVELQKN